MRAPSSSAAFRPRCMTIGEEASLTVSQTLITIPEALRFGNYSLEERGMSEIHYSLAELSELADVSERTVRYYVHEKLMPAPSRWGRRSRYDETHLEALLAIRQLQDDGLTLKDIADFLQSEDLTGLASDAIREGSSVEGEALPEDADGPLKGILGHVPPVSGAVKDSVAKARATAKALAAMPVEVATKAAKHGRGTHSAAPKPSRWERIPITADIEIHVRRPLPRPQGRPLRTLLEHASELFPEGPSETEERQ